MRKPVTIFARCFVICSLNSDFHAGDFHPDRHIFGRVIGRIDADLEPHTLICIKSRRGTGGDGGVDIACRHGFVNGCQKHLGGIQSFTAGNRDFLSSGADFFIGENKFPLTSRRYGDGDGEGI